MNKISMYTLSTCPWCRKTKLYFTERHLTFVRIGDQTVEGYRPDRFAEPLGFKFTPDPELAEFLLEQEVKL